MENKKLDLEKLREIKQGYLEFAKKHKHLPKDTELSFRYEWVVERDVSNLDIDCIYHNILIEDKGATLHEFEIYDRDTVDYLLENDLLKFIDVVMYNVDIMRYELKLDFQDLGL